MLAAKSGWDQLALADAFFNGLSDALKDQLISIELPAELDACIALASTIDKKPSEWEKSRSCNEFQPAPFRAWDPLSPVSSDSH